MKRAALLLIMVLLIGIVPACGDIEDAVGNLTPEQIVERVLASAEAWKTVRFEMEMVGEMEGILESGYSETSIAVNYTGVIDVAARKLQAEMTTLMDVSLDGDQNSLAVSQRIYFLADLGYVGVKLGPGFPEQWVTGAVGQDLWESQELLSQQERLISSAQLKLLEPESVHGIPCYAVEIIPDDDALLEWIRLHLPVDDDLELTMDSLNTYSLRGWFAKDTFFPMRVTTEYDFVLTTGSEIIKGSSVENIVYHDYNEPVNIELPEEAYTALYVGALEL